MNTRTETPFNPIDGHPNFLRWASMGFELSTAQRLGALVEHFRDKYI